MEDVMTNQLQAVVVAVVEFSVTQRVSNVDLHIGSPSHNGPTA